MAGGALGEACAGIAAFRLRLRHQRGARPRAAFLLRRTGVSFQLVVTVEEALFLLVAVVLDEGELRLAALAIRHAALLHQRLLVRR